MNTERNLWEKLAGVPRNGRENDPYALYTGFTMRSIIYTLGFLCMWQGYHFFGSPLQLWWLNQLTPGLTLHEVFLVLTCFALIIERFLQGDFTMERSYFAAPMIIIFIALFLSWVHGCYLRQDIAVVYEAHESIQMVVSFFIMVNIFRDPGERRILFPLFLIATICKGFDGIGVKMFSPQVGSGWGVLLFWRDGFLMALGIIGTLHLMHYQGHRWKWLKKTMMFGAPVIAYTLIISYRRTFFVAIVVSAFLMLATVGKGRRKKQFWLMLGLLFGLGLVIAFSDPIGFIVRMMAVVQPTEEGSAAIRIAEYPNVIRNIYEHPIFGTAIGVPWHEYYPLPLGANFTTLGAHNTYLYWPLRTGLLGTIGFFLLLARAFKALFINIAVQKTEEDWLLNNIALHMMLIYCTASFFGLMYSDAMTLMMGLVLTFFQLQMRHHTGLRSYKRVNFLKTVRAHKLVLRNPDAVLPASVGIGLAHEMS